MAHDLQIKIVGGHLPIAERREQRRFKRVLVQRFGGCVVKLAAPAISQAILTDISVGGMRILIEEDIHNDDIQPGTEVSGEIASENPGLCMKFSAAIAWQRPSSVDGEHAIYMGLRFADYTPLPDALMALIDQHDAVD